MKGDAVIHRLAQDRKLHCELTGLLAVWHLVVVALYVGGRATYSPNVLIGAGPRTGDDAVAQLFLGAHPFWAVLHGVAAVFLVVVLVARNAGWLSQACWFSMAVLIVWGAVTAAWGLSAPAPVSLAGPAMSLFVGVPLAAVCARGWTERER